MAVNRIRPTTAPSPKSTPTRSWKSVVTRIVLKGMLYFFIGSVLWVTVLKFVPVWVTPLMIARKIEAIADGRDSKIYSDWTSFDEMSKEAPLSVVSSEDQLFPEHWGFDFKSMNNAFRYNLKGKKIRGASTISQQVAKNVFLWQGRSYIRKGLEAYFTLLIEVIWGKKRILEVYLNVAETGKMTFGYEAASQRFFNKSASALTRTEAARIAAVLPSPLRFSAKNPSNYVQKRTQQIARQMRMLGRDYIASL
ncbi:monofunctional biosynthetic peptidoglycan transglycosylase [Runella sp. MFBS21]|uniref:monofunctional biosynthetic peptidoglycan transglycosylase n=1 Tax=Runella sp. MFBS21 TaxID=3034018 RepID=UPI0023F81CA4|nr:monofunctional biosynthetic peptidoglycan transglycosylase [Runella sp. MFBS21]MDF7818934.1 monofunctional biosynthetic peptidoglycan transglycosylase [Runella sp. MFBS21]